MNVLAHVKNRDTLIMTMTATLAGAISTLANFAFFGGRSDGNNSYGAIGPLFAALAAPFAAMLVQLAISRTRQYFADRPGAEICDGPMWLAVAMDKIARAAGRIPTASAVRNPASAHLFIVNPLSGVRMDNPFSIHSGTGNRIARLAEPAREMGEGGASLTDGAAAEAVELCDPCSSAGLGPMTATPRGPWSGDRGAGAGATPRRGPWG